MIRTHYLAATLCVAALTTVVAMPAAHAQSLFLGDGQSYTANDAMYQNGFIYVGQNSALNLPSNTVATLNVVDGANVFDVRGYNSSTINMSGGSVTYAEGFNNSTINISGGNMEAAYGFNNSTVNISGGSVYAAIGNNTSTVNISGGNIELAQCLGPGPGTMNISGGSVANVDGTFNSIVNISGGIVDAANATDTSTINISGGSVTNAYGFNNSTLNISGGSVNYAEGFNNSTTNISGGTLTNGFLLFDTAAKVNFVGTGLSLAYIGYGSNIPYGTTMFPLYADFFQVSGTIGGLARTYDLYIRNDNGFGVAGTPNGTVRQFTFNGAAPTVVPEANTFALALPALAIVGAVLVRRRKTAK